MPHRPPNRQLTALLLEAHWSSGELARAVNALGTLQGLPLRYDRTAVAHWLTGSRPNGPVPDLAAQALSHRSGRLITAADTGLAQSLQPHTAPRDRPGMESDPVLRLIALCRNDADPARRADLTQAAYTLAILTLPAWPRTGPLHRPALKRGASSADVQTLTEMTDVFSGLADAHGGAHARSALATYLADDAGRLLTAPAPAGLHRQLLTCCAQLTHLLASMTTDTGHHGLAQRYYTTALTLAHHANDRTTYAITLRAMSTQTLRLGHPRRAADLAEAAVDTAGSAVGPATLAFLLAQRALTHATNGRPRQALADLDTAEHAHDRAAIRPGPFTAYPRAGLDYQRAETFHLLGRPTLALAAFHASARHRTPAQRKSQALTEVRLAEILLSAGQLEEACTHGHTFLDHYPHLHSTQVDQALARLRQHLLSFPNQPHATALQERARTLSPSRTGH
ncbi:hypothetical protein [Streptomyces sp. H27-D2]|uniref:hypothetical protein n=1 Tax=Streptomyces sp. H27-D2 TaxID=3046304 RepID=UPI002DB6D4D1|nr:hypothetical protein [Streptomyces sp. H27-D2]MEC4020693.1 hypothetical protein [Streptomyces sp. H27-D2]